MNKINVLLVDDIPENIFTLEHILESESRNFLTASSGAEALLLSSIEKVDLILLDFKLDDMDGIDDDKAAEFSRESPYPGNCIISPGVIR